MISRQVAVGPMQKMHHREFAQIGVLELRFHCEGSHFLSQLVVDFT